MGKPPQPPLWHHQLFYGPNGSSAPSTSRTLTLLAEWVLAKFKQKTLCNFFFQHFLGSFLFFSFWATVGTPYWVYVCVCVCALSSTNRKSMLRKYSRPQRHATFFFYDVCSMPQTCCSVPAKCHINCCIMNLFQIFKMTTILYFIFCRPWSTFNYDLFMSDEKNILFHLVMWIICIFFAIALSNVNNYVLLLNVCDLKFKLTILVGLNFILSLRN